MIRINLLDPRASAGALVPPAPKRLPTIVVVLALIGPAFALAGYRHRLDRSAAVLDVEVQEASLTHERISGEAERVEALDAQIAALRDRFALIERVRTRRLATVDLLEATGDSVPDDIWLTRLTGRPTTDPVSGIPADEGRGDPVLELDGRAGSLASVTGLVDALEASGAIGTKVEVVRTTTDPAGSPAGVHFTLKARGEGE